MTSRQGGVSASPWDSMNLGDHVGDRSADVHTNRERLAAQIGQRPVFLQQVHGVASLQLGAATPQGLVADACWSQNPGVACTIMVADCLPVLLCDAAGRWVAAAHAGWRGLAGPGESMKSKGLGVLENLWADLKRAGADVSDMMAWLGPCNDSSLPWCTGSGSALFFSHRRDSRNLGQSGRMAACIWLDR